MPMLKTENDQIEFEFDQHNSNACKFDRIPIGLTMETTNKFSNWLDGSEVVYTNFTPGVSTTNGGLRCV